MAFESDRTKQLDDRRETHRSENARKCMFVREGEKEKGTERARVCKREREGVCVRESIGLWSSMCLSILFVAR